MLTYTDMLQQVNEKVSVIAIYDKSHGEVTPWRIKWNGRIYTITEIGFHHTLRHGNHLYHIFSVTDGNLSFKLTCDTETLHWTLEEISDGVN